MRRMSPLSTIAGAAAAVAMMGMSNPVAGSYAPPPPQFQLRDESEYRGERGRQKRKRLAREASGRRYQENRRRLEQLRRVDAAWNQAMQCLTNRMKMRWNAAGMPGLRKKDPREVWKFHPLYYHRGITWDDYYMHLQNQRYAGNR
jgi:hypothetical protein